MSVDTDMVVANDIKYTTSAHLDVYAHTLVDGDTRFVM